LAGRTPEEALDAYVEQISRALSCVTDAVVFGRASSSDHHHTLSIYATRQSRPNRLHLDTNSRRGEILLLIAERFRLERVSDAVHRDEFDVAIRSYFYRILDRDEREIVAYHWHPEGRSTFDRPHLHVPAAEPIVLAQPSGSPLTGVKTHLSRLHLPTGRIGIEEIVELLITDFAVDPLRSDWKELLSPSREVR
jgi:hypothetical protein